MEINQQTLTFGIWNLEEEGKNVTMICIKKKFEVVT